MTNKIHKPDSTETIFDGQRCPFVSMAIMTLWSHLIQKWIINHRIHRVGKTSQQRRALLSNGGLQLWATNSPQLRDRSTPPIQSFHLMATTQIHQSVIEWTCDAECDSPAGRRPSSFVNLVLVRATHHIHKQSMLFPCLNFVAITFLLLFAGANCSRIR